MKNLLIYISPNKKLNPEHEKMLEVQIENSLDYWDEKDIVLAFNFPYEYRGIKAIEVPDLINSQYPENPRAIINSKINVIIYLLENGLIEELTWFHDFDAFQVGKFDEIEVKSIGLVKYGIYPKSRLQPIGDYTVRVNCGSIFFTPEGLGTFKELLERMDRNKHYEEDELTIMYAEEPKKFRIMDQGYNIGIRNTLVNIRIASRPIKVVHFPPDNPKWLKAMKFLLGEKLKRLLEVRFCKILITGSEGFIGSHLMKRLDAVGITINVEDKEELRSYFRNAEYVIHTAAKIRGEGIYKTNVKGTRNVVELCKEYGCKLIHLGTIEKRGEYGESKTEAEKIVANSGIQGVVLELPPIYTKEMLPAKYGYYPMEKLVEDIVEIVNKFPSKYEKRIFIPQS